MRCLSCSSRYFPILLPMKYPAAIPREVPIALLSLPPILLPIIPPVITPNVEPIFSLVPMFSQDVRVSMDIVRARTVRISLFIVC
ncbi:hypothetical protein D3C75_1185320 [compost metagenome]